MLRVTDVLMHSPQGEEAEAACLQTRRPLPQGKEQIAIESVSTFELSRAPQGEAAERVYSQMHPPRPRGKGEVVIAKIETSLRMC